MRRLDWGEQDSHVLVAGPYRLDRARPESLRAAFMAQAKIGTADHKADFFRAKHNRDVEAALKVVRKTLDTCYLHRVEQMQKEMGSNAPVFVAPVRKDGHNAMAATAASYLGEMLNQQVDKKIVEQPGNTRKDMVKISKLFEFPSFSGDVEPGRHYIVVDDMVGLGSTIAELRSYIIRKGGIYDFACCLASPSGQDHLINPFPFQEGLVRKSIGDGLVKQFEEKTGINIASLTRKESFLLAGDKARETLPKFLLNGLN